MLVDQWENANYKNDITNGVNRLANCLYHVVNASKPGTIDVCYCRQLIF